MKSFLLLVGCVVMTILIFYAAYQISKRQEKGSK